MCSGDLWFSALTHGNSASVCLQAFSLMGCGYELLKLEEKLETRLSTRDMWKGDLLALPLLPLPPHQQLLRCSAFHHRRPSAASTHPATPTTTSRPQLFIPQCRSASNDACSSASAIGRQHQTLLTMCMNHDHVARLLSACLCMESMLNV